MQNYRSYIKQTIIGIILLALCPAIFIIPVTGNARAHSVYDIVMGGAAVEVLLNKPGISYNLTILKSLKNVIPVEYSGTREAYAYRSHFNKELTVIVSLQGLKRLEDERYYIAIRLQSPLINITETLYHYSTSIAKEITIDKDYIEKLGWKIESQAEKGNKQARAVFTRLGKSLAKNVTATIKITTTYRNKETKSTITVTIKAKELKDRYISEINKVLNYLANTKVSKEEFKRLTNPKFKPKYDEATLKNALKVELKWLREINVIKRLTDKDIERLVDAMRIGYSGWNSRLVYYNGEWHPYSKVVEDIGGLLLKVREPIRGLESLPEEPPKVRTQTITTIKEKKPQWDRYMGLLLALTIATISAITIFIITKRL